MSSPVSGSDVGKVGLATAIAIVVANMIGTGVFGSLGFQVAGIPSGFPILVLWLVGGIVSFCGAVCYAELASIFPKSGGEYHILSKAWNPFIGFLAGWISVTVGFAERYGEDQWTFLMRETDGEGRTVLNYAPSDDAATMLVACLTFAGHEARTLDHGGYAWTAPTAEEEARFDADLLHCRIAHPFPG
jgi:hypothetical protein